MRRHLQPLTGRREGEILNVPHCALQAFSDSSTPENKASLQHHAFLCHPTLQKAGPTLSRQASSSLTPARSTWEQRESVPVWTPHHGSLRSFS